MNVGKTIRNLGIGFLTVAGALTPGLPGKWSGSVQWKNMAVPLSYSFTVDGQNLTGEVEGPDGSVPIINGTYKDSLLTFDFQGRTVTIHNTGKYYGDSVTVDFMIKGEPLHIHLTKAN